MKKPNQSLPRRGGQRPGAGRPSGRGPYGEPTKAIRVPLSLIPELQAVLAECKQRQCAPDHLKPVPSFRPTVQLPLFGHRVAAGLPLYADDHIEDRLDLADYLAPNPETTFLVQVEGESMLNAGIHPDDLLVVDQSIQPEFGKVVVAAVNGELTVKRLIRQNGKHVLMPENPAYEPIWIDEQADVIILGVVTNVIHHP